MSAAVRYAIGELATLGGVSRRTVRYYVHEGLIPPPLGLGRGNHYTPDHLEQLLRVKSMQESGRTLDDIRGLLNHRPQSRAPQQPSRESVPERSLWRRIALTSGVELHVASTVRIPTPAQLQELAEWCHQHFIDSRNTSEKED
jgi:DNA-binding transcriptional MerR regulator